MSPLEWAGIAVGIAAGIVAIQGAILGLARWVTEQQPRARVERAEEKARQIEVKYEELLREVAIARRIGTAALIKKGDIDDDLVATMETIRAQGASILVQSPSLVPGVKPAQQDLVFLAIHGAAAATLRRLRVPMDSIAGDVFLHGTRPEVGDATQDSRHYTPADAISGHTTGDMLTYPLFFGGERVGVMQFVHKKGEARFEEADAKLVDPFLPALSAKVADFIRNPDNFEILGVAVEREAEDATVIFCDLTNSSQLFTFTGVTVAIDLINEYLQVACDVGLEHGATIGQSFGDGVMLQLNVPRPLRDHPQKAVRLALEIQAAFGDSKDRWLKARRPVGDLYSRIGIAYGLVHRAIMGHPQYQQITIMGEPVNVASNLCEHAARDRNVTVIDQRLYGVLSDQVEVRQVPKQVLGKAARFVSSAYELLSIR